MSGENPEDRNPKQRVNPLCAAESVARLIGSAIERCSEGDRVEQRKNPFNQSRAPLHWRAGTKTDMVYSFSFADLM